MNTLLDPPPAPSPPVGGVTPGAKATEAKPCTLPKRMSAMEEGYGINFAATDDQGRDMWEVGPVGAGGAFVRSYVVRTDGEDTPTFCPYPSPEKPRCKHMRFLYRHLHEAAQRGACPQCDAQQRGGVLFSERREFAGRGAIYVWKCDVCAYERVLI